MTNRIGHNDKVTAKIEGKPRSKRAIGESEDESPAKRRKLDSGERTYPFLHLLQTPPMSHMNQNPSDVTRRAQEGIQQLSELSSEAESSHQYFPFAVAPASSSAKSSSSSTTPMPSPRFAGEPNHLSVQKVYHNTIRRRDLDEKAELPGNNVMRNVLGESKTEAQIDVMEKQMCRWEARRDAEAEGAERDRSVESDDSDDGLGFLINDLSINTKG